VEINHEGVARRHGAHEEDRILRELRVVTFVVPCELDAATAIPQSAGLTAFALGASASPPWRRRKAGRYQHQHK
jgi:hypothetical protein